MPVLQFVALQNQVFVRVSASHRSAGRRGRSYEGRAGNQVQAHNGPAAHRQQKRYRALELAVIHASERGAPKGRKPETEWKLITDLPVRGRAEAIEKIDWCAMRWKIGFNRRNHRRDHSRRSVMYRRGPHGLPHVVPPFGPAAQGRRRRGQASLIRMNLVAHGPDHATKLLMPRMRGAPSLRLINRACRTIARNFSTGDGGRGLPTWSMVSAPNAPSNSVAVP